jgi:ATP synthase I chain
VGPDPLVARIIRMAAIICAAASAVAWAVAGPRMALGVLGGGLLIAISLYTIGGGVSAIVAAASGQSFERQKLAGTLVKVVLRYALLAFLAYVMIARLRLHPVGLLVGATSITAAVFVEAVRLHTKRS